MSWAGARPHKVQVRLTDAELEELDEIITELKSVMPLLAPDRSSFIRYSIRAMWPFVRRSIEIEKENAIREKAELNQTKIK